VLRWIAHRLQRRPTLAQQLRSPKSLKKYLEGLSALKPEHALRAVSGIFEEVPSLKLPSAQLIEALDACDHYAQRLCLVLTDELMENLPKQMVREPIWNTLLSYHRAREKGYRACLLRLETTLPGNEQAYTTSVIFACRAANALARRCVLLGMTYADPGHEVWWQIAQLGAECRVAARSVALTTLYASDVDQTSLEREYLAILLFQSAPIGNLLPTQHHALDLLLRQHAQHFELRDRFDAEARPFVIESHVDARPTRWLPGRKERPGMRFFGPGFAGTEILRERDRAESARRVPHFVQASGITLPLYRELLERVIQHWSLAPPARRHRRHSSQGQVLVGRDLAHVHRLLTFSEMARSGRSLQRASESDYAVESILRSRELPQRASLTAPPTSVSATEALNNLKTYEDALGRDATAAWTLVDASNEGIGAEAITRGPRLTVGLLVAYRDPESIEWKLATIRRLNRGDAGRIRVGLATMEGRPYPVRLSLDRATPAPETVSGPALHYEVIKLVAAATYLLVPPGVFGPGWRYTLTEQRRWDLIEVDSNVESGLDFDRAQIRLVQSSKAA